jgi:hypothetical protein
MRVQDLIGIIAFASSATASPLTDAVWHRDITALETAPAASPDETELARGAALALHHQDEPALALLVGLARSHPRDGLGAAACLALSDIYLRQTRYRDAHDALRCVQDASGEPLRGEPLQILEDTAALAGEAPMQLSRAAVGTIDVHRDHAGLMRVTVDIAGQATAAVIDSDASFSAVSQSMARRLGLRVLQPELAIVTTARPDQPMHLAVADQMHFGSAILCNVVFVVLPDAAMRFSRDYRMEAVIGLPVLMALGRVAFDDDTGVLDYGRRETLPAGQSNLIVSGLDPFVLVTICDRTARLALDTAADKTSLNASVRMALPQTGKGRDFAWHGAGGEVVDRSAHRLDHWRFRIGDSPVTLHDVPVLSRSEDDRDGALGIDALKGARRWVLDFEAMRLIIVP